MYGVLEATFESLANVPFPFAPQVSYSCTTFRDIVLHKNEEIRVNRGKQRKTEIREKRKKRKKEKKRKKKKEREKD